MAVTGRNLHQRVARHVVSVAPWKMNLNRRIMVVELPGSDATKAQVVQGPYLFGANEDLTPVTLRLQDIDDDAKNDLVLSVKQEEVIYINTGENFRLISADERIHLQKAP